MTPEEAGYVRSTTPRKCGTCEYYEKPDICNLPLDIPVDPELDCCNHWEPKIKKPDDIINAGESETDQYYKKLFKL